MFQAKTLQYEHFKHFNCLDNFANRDFRKDLYNKILLRKYFKEQVRVGGGVTGIFIGLLAALHGGTAGVGIWESFVVSANKIIMVDTFTFISSSTMIRSILALIAQLSVKWFCLNINSLNFKIYKQRWNS